MLGQRSPHKFNKIYRVGNQRRQTEVPSRMNCTPNVRQCFTAQRWLWGRQVKPCHRVMAFSRKHERDQLRQNGRVLRPGCQKDIRPQDRPLCSTGRKTVVTTHRSSTKISMTVTGKPWSCNSAQSPAARCPTLGGGVCPEPTRRPLHAQHPWSESEPRGTDDELATRGLFLGACAGKAHGSCAVTQSSAMPPFHRGDNKYRK